MLDGNSIADTYSSTERIEELESAFGFGNDFSRQKNISGSGFLNEKTFWFDVGIRCRFLTSMSLKSDATDVY